MNEETNDELALYKKAFPHCDKHKPVGGHRSGCLICGLIQQADVISRIDYLLGDPNEMECSMFDVDHDEERVLRLAETRIAELQENTARLKAMMPLFEEARDALPAITRTAARLRKINLTLADRMDDVGNEERWQKQYKERKP